MTLEAALAALEPEWGDALVICANGFISRRAFTQRDRAENFYMIGSMGLASSIGLGLALARPERKVVILDGDGNLLMNLGALAMIAAEAPPNLQHVVLDNGVYASTGNQPTISGRVCLAEMARAAGYKLVSVVSDPSSVGFAIQRMLQQPGPNFLKVELEVETGPFTAGRVVHTPEELRDRFAVAARQDPRREP